LFPRIAPGYFLCHKIEEKLGTSGTLFQQLQSAGLVQDQGVRMFNAGVIGINCADAGFLETPLDLLDRFYPDLGKIYIFEQICISVATHGRLKLNTCVDVLSHYWSRKKIVRAKIQVWFEKHKDAPLSEAAIFDLARINVHIPRPNLLTRLRIKLALPLFPKAMRQFAKEILYGSLSAVGANEFDRAASLAYQKKAIENVLKKNEWKCVASWFEHPLLRKMTGVDIAALREMLRQK
jgi:hypothetical protein